MSYAGVVELFAGPGGWSTGLRAAGYAEPVVGIEWDLPACRTAVTAGHPRVRADVATYPLEVFAGCVGLIASPPCPSFSAAGSGAGKLDIGAVCERMRAFSRGQAPPEREWADERSALTAEPARWVADLRPRWVALEQVPQVLPMWRYLAHLLRELGYQAWCGVLSAEEYGVPQTRKRAVLVASLDGPVGPPVPTHQSYRNGAVPLSDDDMLGPPLPPPVSMATALDWSGCTGWTLRSNYGTGGDPADRGERRSDQPATTVTGKVGRNVWLRNGSQDNAYVRSIDEPAGTIFFGPHLNAVDWVVSPATTVCGDARIGPHVHHDHAVGEPQYTTGPIRITLSEAGVLQGFPPDYPWRGTKSQRHQQVGNAVPPPLAEAVLRPLLATPVDVTAALPRARRGTRP